MTLTILSAACAEALGKEIPVSVVVVDDDGTPVSFVRMDGASATSVEIAQHRAHTAVGFGMPPDEWFEFLENDLPPVPGGAGGIRRHAVFGGGAPTMVAGVVGGGIGVSGGHWSDDIEIARAALEATW